VAYSEWTTGKICVQFLTLNGQQSIANQFNSTQILAVLNTLHCIADRTVRVPTVPQDVVDKHGPNKYDRDVQCWHFKLQYQQKTSTENADTSLTNDINCEL